MAERIELDMPEISLDRIREILGTSYTPVTNAEITLMLLEILKHRNLEWVIKQTIIE